jgi:hypothetical protein
MKTLFILDDGCGEQYKQLPGVSVLLWWARSAKEVGR